MSALIEGRLSAPAALQGTTHAALLFGVNFFAVSAAVLSLTVFFTAQRSPR